MIAGIAATKADLTEWVYEQGLTALHLLLREDAEEIAGLKGKHEKERTHNHWGSTNGELSFGGRRIQVSRPRVRSKSGEEASLPHFEAFREEDPLPERVLNQILVGVSTRNYESSLDKPAAKLKSRGTSKSAASRHLVSQTTKKLEEYLSRRLEEFELAALMLDGLEVAGQTIVVTLGITIDGTKVPLGIWLGSTENSRVCTAMLQDLLERGLRVDASIFCVVDGGKGIRKALVDVLGDLAVIQRQPPLGGANFGPFEGLTEDKPPALRGVNLTFSHVPGPGRRLSSRTGRFSKWATIRPSPTVRSSSTSLR